MTVWVVQEQPNLDYGDAENWGEVQFMTAEEFRPTKNSIRNDHVIASITRAMGGFDPANDYLVLTGNPIIIGYAVHLALSKAEGNPIRILHFDRIQGGYREALLNPEAALANVEIDSV